MSKTPFGGRDSPLFREEVLERFRGSAWQPVLLSRPISAFLLMAFSLAVATAVLVFSATFEFARKEQVRGYLIPADGWSRVTATSFGIVSQRIVDTGDSVRSGDVLLEISSGDGAEQAQTFQDRMLEEIHGRRSTLDARSRLIQAQYEKDYFLLAQQDAFDRSELNQLSVEIEIAEAWVDSASEQLRNARRLAVTGALARTDVVFVEEELHSRLLSLSERQREVDRLRERLATSATRLEQLTVIRDLNLASIDEQRHVLAMEVWRIGSEVSTRVLAPRSGKVASVRVEIGDGVRPGQELLDIIPPESNLQGRLVVPSAAMGFVQQGQDVRVYLDAFPYERHGAQSARVLSVSGTTLAARETRLNNMHDDAVYHVDVEFPYGFTVPTAQLGALRPGMTMTADLVRDYGTLLDWVMEPLQGTARRL